MSHSNSIPTHLFFLVCAVFILACETAPTYSAPQMMALDSKPLPASSHQSGFRFIYDGELDSQAPASVQVTIAVIEPEYRVAESALDTKLYRRVGKGFAASMGVDMQKILVGKGLTVKGPFRNLQEITYSQKKESDLTLAPQVYLDVRFQYVGGIEMNNGGRSKPGQAVLMGKHNEQKAWAVKLFELSVSGYFVFRMQEPLSGETMWIKRIPLDEVVTQGWEVYEANPIYASGGYETTETMLVDQKSDKLADIMEGYYKLVLRKLQLFIEVVELEELKKKTKEIRKLKRY